MGIRFDETSGLFCLETKTTSYVIGIADGAYVGHVYYGRKLKNYKGIEGLLRTQEPPFVPSVNLREKGSFMDAFPWEYPVWGVGDYRDSCLMVRTQQGHRACEPVYTGYRILEGKPALEGLPSTFAKDFSKREESGVMFAEDFLKHGKTDSVCAGDFSECERFDFACGRDFPGHGKIDSVQAGIPQTHGKSYSAQDEDSFPALSRESSCAQTLEIDCTDPCIGLKVILSYSVFEDSDAVIRSVRLVNEGTEPLYIERALSAGFDFDMDSRGFEMLTLTGSWARERRLTRCLVTHGRHAAGSVRGMSSHQEHPFLALMTPGATQEEGEVYAMHFVYSGNFLAFAQQDQHETVRMAMGIHPDGFEWMLEPGEIFQTPEVVCVYSDEGLGKMSRTFHDLYRSHLIRSRYLHRKRPVLLNCWEAVYFDFNEEKIVSIAHEAAREGIELLVLDDGWFGHRDSDDSSLGDWEADHRKLPGGLKSLSEKVKAEGLSFGLWFEPEMISPDSELYRAHPDWALQIPGRTPTLSRAQYVLDLSRQEVVDYVYESVARILRSADISYLKWDVNRQLTDVGSCALPAARQGELFHRQVLGVYQLQERLVTEFPDLLLENCCSGGGRFDPGMLYYSPQIWCSDNTDAAERLAIQEGTALLYPLSCIGSHVSACPNHMVGRMTPLETRGYAALAGTFGYELDVTKLTEEEKQTVREQIQIYHTYADLIREGDYYRIASWQENHRYDCWIVVAKDKSEALLTCVQVLAEANRRSLRICPKGLDPEADYQMNFVGKVAASSYDCQEGKEMAKSVIRPEKKELPEISPKEKKPSRSDRFLGTGKIFGGTALMYGGFLLPRSERDFAGILIHFTKKY